MQTSYSAHPDNAFAGMVADISAADIVSKICNVRQLFSVAVTTEYNSEIFTVTINGNAYAYTSDTNGTKAEIAAGIKALIDAGDDDVTVTLFTTSETDDSFYIEPTSYDADELAVTITNPSNGVLTLTELIAYGQTIPFGSVVCEDERASAGSQGKREGVRLPRLAADVTTLGKTQGIAIADTSKVAEAAGYVAGEGVPVLKKGRVWVHVEDVASVALGGLVYVRRVAGAGESLGAIRAVDDSSDTDVLPYQQCHFTGQKITALGLAIIELDL